MPALIFYIFLIIIELFFFIFFTIFTFFLIYSLLKGSPYVPSKINQIRKILKSAYLKKNQIFFDLGCGDGRVVREAVKHYQVKGIGYDINLILILWARLLSVIQNLSSIEFKQADIVTNKFPDADVIYIFLMPLLIKKISQKLYLQLKNGALIISHGFKIKSFNKYLIKQIDDKQFSTYFYQWNSRN